MGGRGRGQGLKANFMGVETSKRFDDSVSYIPCSSSFLPSLYEAEAEEEEEEEEEGGARLKEWIRTNTKPDGMWKK